ncbi:cytochrome C [Bacillus sp. FJAT-18017]|uniref:cytochrome c3 family protein n=1 Tax=Bacillus sp. FJAT-18017 TaxID=1705566 RepID=UPI0006AF8B13|nr:NapC/NirT family cytochrome c [Bacillus sp. FJAT-18017]ALC88789.1 cytochrome C [Bacillus sp. FJAT-18017]
MEEEQKDQQTELPAPPRLRNTIFKIMTLTLLFLVLFFSIGFVGLEATSSSEFCSSCHEMKPEYYTWKASSHGEVDCVNCHIEPGVENLAKAKGNGIVELYKKQTQTYTAPIQMPKDIPDSACEKCHNMNSRQVTPSGDLIIPHDKHTEKDIECVQCHSGIAHGKIAERKVTFKTDYEKWDIELGTAMMSDKKFTNPKMEKCMDCHIARKVTTECSACHTTNMYPESHKRDEFKTETHGTLAGKEIKECNECHKYMSDKETTLFNDEPAHKQFLKTKKIETKKVNTHEYAKENTFCKDCHTQRPASHIKGFIKSHGTFAKNDDSKCQACHDLQKTGLNKISNVTCNSCHPSSHANKEWRKTHPVEVPKGAKVTKTCYQCHNEQKCQSCHKED